MKIVLLQIGISIILYACSSNNDIDRSIQDITTNSLHNANIALSHLSSESYKSINQKKAEGNYGRLTAIWHVKAMHLKSLSRTILNQFDSISTIDKSSSEKLFYLKQKYISDVLFLDTSLEEKFKSKIDSFLFYYGTSVSVSFYKEKSKNDILIIESELAEYFNNQFSYIIEDYSKFSATVSQNTTHLKVGETLEVFAAIGQFTIASKPIFKINGEQVLPGTDAVAIYKLKAMQRGKKTVPVQIIFTKSDGLKDTINNLINYHVD